MLRLINNSAFLINSGKCHYFLGKKTQNNNTTQRRRRRPRSCRRC